MTASSLHKAPRGYPTGELEPLAEACCDHPFSGSVLGIGWSKWTKICRAEELQFQERFTANWAMSVDSIP